MPNSQNQLNLANRIIFDTIKNKSYAEDFIFVSSVSHFDKRLVLSWNFCLV